MPFDVTTSSVSVHSTNTSGIAYSSPAPVTAVKSGKTEVGHSPNTGSALLAGTAGAGASVATTSAPVVVVCSTASVLDTTVVVSASDDELQATNAKAIIANAICREIFIPTF
jgi:hypothetical protein